MVAKVRTWTILGSKVEEEQKKSESSGKIDPRKVLVVTSRTLPKIKCGEVLVRILTVSIEGNVAKHLVTGYPINQANKLGGTMFPGNAMVAEVIDQVGTKYRPGEIVVSQCWQHDKYGDPMSVVGFDTDSGWFGDFAIVKSQNILPVPTGRDLSIFEMTALALKAPCAVHLWRRSKLLWQKSESVPEKVSILGFGGGVSALFLLLAKKLGHDVYFCSGSVDQWSILLENGIKCIDQNKYNRFCDTENIKSFRNDFLEMTDGVGAHIVCDLMRGKLFDAGLSIMAKYGINLCCGWQLSNVSSFNQARLCVNQQDIINVHMASSGDVNKSIELWGSTFKLPIHPKIFCFDDLPEAVDLVLYGKPLGSVIVQIAKYLPEKLLK